MNKSEIRKEVVVNNSAKNIFKAISDEQELTKWWVDVPKLELKHDGKMLFRFLKENSQQLEKDFVVEGKVIEIIPNKKLVYTWKPTDDPNYPNSIVTWTIDNEDSNKTRITVVHSGLEEVNDYDKLEKGWAYFINRLSTLYK